MGKRIGIIIHSGAALFSNGITQNAWYIYECLSLCGYSCEFLCHEKDPKPFGFKGVGLRSFAYEFPYHEYFLIIGVTKGLFLEQYKSFNALGIPVVQFICGNHFMIDLEQFVNSKNQNSSYANEKVQDVIWIIPSFYYFATYLETLKGVPVYEIPHLWSPKILEHRTLTLSKVDPSALFFKNKSYKTFEIIILEPNMNVVKNAVLGLTVAEILYKRYPSLIKRVYVANIPKNEQANRFMNDLSVPIYIQNGYKEMDEILLSINNSESMPIFICNQLYHSLNYLYYECFYYGYPLVHNSLSLDGKGYYYPDYDIVSCSKAVMNAFKTHLVNLDTYLKENKKYLERVNPYSPEMHALWKQAVLSVTS
jgi:hypothetical protein